MSEQTAKRRARRARQRREEILQAAARVFARKGYEKATTREIAEEADIAEGTIYNYFDSKEQLVLALAEVVRQEIIALIPESPAGADVRLEVGSAVERVLAVIAEHAMVIRGLVTALWDRGPSFQGFLIPGAHDWIKRVASYLEQRMASGEICSCDAETVARMVMGMVVYLVMPHLQGLEPAPTAAARKEQARLLVSVLFDGLQAREV